MLEPIDDQELAAQHSAAAAAPRTAGKDAAEEEKSNKPPTSSFHQQQLAACQPLITAGTVFPLFLTLGAIFVAMGIPLLIASSSIVEVSLDYTKCTRVSDSAVCSELIERYKNYSVCSCRLNFTLSSDMPGQVYAYYALTSFYQNHRKYVKSRDNLQLSGRRSVDLDADCEPYRRDRNTSAWIAPCGAIANSLFSDTFQLLRRPSGEEEIDPVPWTGQGISSAAEVARKYGRVDSWNGTAKPPNWPVPESVRSPAGYQDDEELQVWLSVAALPSFRKLHRRLLRPEGSPYAAGLPAGNYSLLVNYSYPVASFGGTKAFVLSTAGLMGGRNDGLGGLSLAVGCLYLALSCFFGLLYRHGKRCREIDPLYGMDPEHRDLLESMLTRTSSSPENFIDVNAAVATTPAAT